MEQAFKRRKSRSRGLKGISLYWMYSFKKYTLTFGIQGKREEMKSRSRRERRNIYRHQPKPKGNHGIQRTSQGEVINSWSLTGGGKREIQGLQNRRTEHRRRTKSAATYLIGAEKLYDRRGNRLRKLPKGEGNRLAACNRRAIKTHTERLSGAARNGSARTR